MQLGAMLLTWTPDPVPYDKAFDTIKVAVDAMPDGVKLFVNSGKFLAGLLASRPCRSLYSQGISTVTIVRQPT